MFDILQKSHSHTRYLILALLVVLIILSLYGLLSKKPWSKINKILNLINLIAMDLQFLIGVILYFGYSSFGLKAFSNPDVSVMKDAAIRKIAIEHFLMMVIAWVLIHMGYTKIKNSKTPHKAVLGYYGVALVLILAAIPWGKI